METVAAKTIINRVRKPSSWFGTEFNMNIYRGCSHGCIYCDSRSNCYRNPDFNKVKVKENALHIIRDELRRKPKTGVVATGAMSDPYNPLEEKLKLTRNALELIDAFNFGVSIATKSPLVCRDIDVLQDIKTHSPVVVQFTITAADENLCKIIEPNAPTTEERLEALSRLADADVFCGVLMMPILPFINDTEENIKNIVYMAKEAGAKFIIPALGITLRAGSREYFYNQLDIHFPGVKEKYIKRYGNRYNCTSPNVKQLWQVFTEECEELELLYDMRAITSYYKMDYDNGQMRLF